MENNFIDLKVVLNHYEIKEIQSQQFHVYTFTEYNSGNSFDCWLPNKLDFLDKMKILIEIKRIKFELLVKKTGSIKLKPVEFSKEV